MSHNMTLKRSPLMMSSPYRTHYESKNILSYNDVCWCWKLTSCSMYPLTIACSSYLTLKTPKDAPLQNLIIIGHTHGLEETCQLVLDGYPHYSPSLALAKCTYSSIGISSLPSIKEDMEFANSFFISFILIAHIHHPWQKLALQPYQPKTPTLDFVLAQVFACYWHISLSSFIKPSVRQPICHHTTRLMLASCIPSPLHLF